MSTQIDALPDAPAATDPVETFDAKAFAFNAALQTFRTQANALGGEMQTNADVAAALITAMALPQFMGTSTSSLAIGTGAKSFATQTGKEWVVGQVVIASSGSNYMKGQVAAYNAGTGVLDVNVTSVNGSGTFASWTIGLSYEGLSLAKSGINSDIKRLLGLEGPGLLPVGAVIYVAYNKLDDGFLKMNGGTVSRAAYPELFAKLVKSGTATASIATPGVVTWTAHGRSANDPVKWQTTGALPTGYVAATTYYVVGASITPNTFQLSATPGGAAINTTGSQSGVHTAIHAPFGDGDGATTFQLPEGRSEFFAGWDDGRGIDVNRSFGSYKLDQMQGHRHSLSAAIYTASSGGLGTASGGSSGLAVLDPITDGANGTPRVGATTHPRHVALMACIKY